MSVLNLPPGQVRCLKCAGCKEFQTQWAAFGAAISEADTKDKSEGLRASWNAYKQENAEELRCTNPQPEGS